MHSISSEDYYAQLMRYAYALHVLGRADKFYKLDACNAINSTCGVDMKVIKELVCIYQGLGTDFKNELDFSDIYLLA